ncbi:hypothetical protein EJB05_33242 [Eragrostis curvula]|uniref:Auxin-responsive protein n=1 Tax=Eragrostis curvula TaxID=38414 RepID=A0A5J9U0P5_9POAL|nr:hypothetical protein EJB05_33242 [Eragrostis curvula]
MSEGTARSSTESSPGSPELDLTLGLGSDPDRKRAPTSDSDGRRSTRAPAAAAGASPPSKKPVVGWPPVNPRWVKHRGKFVKVVADGELIGRKMNLESYAGYEQLLAELQGMFTSQFTVRKVGNEEMKLVDVASGTEYVPTYEDKDGDWMLVGDVPWRMFVDTCQRLRLMKSSEAINLCTTESRSMKHNPRSSSTNCFGGRDIFCRGS